MESSALMDEAVRDTIYFIFSLTAWLGGRTDTIKSDYCWLFNTYCVKQLNINRKYITYSSVECSPMRAVYCSLQQMSHRGLSGV